jgi:aminocarboxymuconate-semialdehyde decarboxylase
VSAAPTSTACKRTAKSCSRSIVGDCVDETLFFWYLICGGALDVFPKLKTYITHSGGMAVFQLGRLSELNKGMAPDARNKKPVMDYMPNFWFDLDVHSPALRRGVLEVVGVDRLVHGTNFGGAYDNGDPTLGLGLNAADSEKVRSGNAIELLNLST